MGSIIVETSQGPVQVDISGDMPTPEEQQAIIQQFSPSQASQIDIDLATASKEEIQDYARQRRLAGIDPATGLPLTEDEYISKYKEPGVDYTTGLDSVGGFSRFQFGRMDNTEEKSGYLQGIVGEEGFRVDPLGRHILTQEGRTKLGLGEGRELAIDEEGFSFNDVKEFAGIPHFVNQRVGVKNIEWHFFGQPPKGETKDEWQLDVWRNYKNTLLKGFRGEKNWYIHDALPTHMYGVIFAHFDVAIAPLQMNDFNDSKSEIKLAECGRYKVPLIASNVGCYDETIVNGKTGYLIEPDAPKSEWVKVLTKVCKDKNHRESMGNNLHAITEEYFDLNKVAVKRLELYRDTFQIKNHTELYEKLNTLMEAASV